MLFLTQNFDSVLIKNKELLSSRRRFNWPTPTCRRVKSSRDVGELVFNPVQLIRSWTYRKVKYL